MNAMVFSVAGKEEEWWRWVRDCNGPRREEFENFNDRMEITFHETWLVKSPQQSQVITVVDGPGAKDFLQRMANSREPFDKWMRERATECLGIDFSNLNKMPTAESVLEYRAPTYAGAGEK